MSMSPPLPNTMSFSARSLPISGGGGGPPGGCACAVTDASAGAKASAPDAWTKLRLVIRAIWYFPPICWRQLAKIYRVFPRGAVDLSVVNSSVRNGLETSPGRDGVPRNWDAADTAPRYGHRFSASYAGTRLARLLRCPPIDDSRACGAHAPGVANRW